MGQDTELLVGRNNSHEVEITSFQETVLLKPTKICRITQVLKMRKSINLANIHMH